MMPLHKPQRVQASEFMDLGPAYYTSQEWNDMLYKLGTINTLLLGNYFIYRAIDTLTPKPSSIIDVGCGAGRSTLKIALRYPAATVVGIDIDQRCIERAQTIHPDKPANLNFELQKELSLQLPEKSYDVVLCMLVCHHMSDDEIIEFISHARRAAKRCVIISDLHRHPLAIAGYSLLAPLFNNRLILYDGLISILKSFTRQDWHYYCKQAHVPETHYRISWNPAFRFTVMIYS